MKSLDLDVASPEELPQVLRRAADVFRESHEQLKANWQDPTAGLVWAKFAQILDRAATSAEKAVERHLPRCSERRPVPKKRLNATSDD